MGTIRIVEGACKAFLFKAIKRGQTQVIFANCEMNASGRCAKELEVQPYSVSIR